MKPYPVELRKKIVKVYQLGGISIRRLAHRFDVSKGFVQKMLKQQAEQGQAAFD